MGAVGFMRLVQQLSSSLVERGSSCLAAATAKLTLVERIMNLRRDIAQLMSLCVPFISSGTGCELCSCLQRTDFDVLIKRWPFVVINSDSPQEALTFLSRQLPCLPDHLPPDLTRFAYELHAASRYVMHHPPSWCPVRVLDRSRAAPFRFYEPKGLGEPNGNNTKSLCDPQQQYVSKSR